MTPESLSRAAGWTRRALGLAVAAVLMAAAPAASAMTPYVVADVDSGAVLAQDNATVPWYPASVTKLMTAYVALSAVKAGRISLDTAIPISRRAETVPPSKVGARPGTEVTLDNALKMMLVKSANDMAMVVAEGVGGSIEAFADLMNEQATRLGMHESRFVNPNGLYVVGQQTSARDMAILARALLRDFPEYEGYFGIGAVQLGDRLMKNTNGLIGRYPGVIGMKTGFICPSGFNLVAVAQRNGRRIVAVVMGASSGADRVIKAADLLDRGFVPNYFTMKGSLDSLPPSGITTPPDVRDTVCGRHRRAPASEDEGEDANANGRPEVLAFVGDQPSNGVRGDRPGRLAERGPLETIPVFLGRTGASDAAPRAANADSMAVTVQQAQADSAAASSGQDAAPAHPAKVKAKAGRHAKAKASAKAHGKASAHAAKPAKSKAEAAKAGSGKAASTKAKKKPEVKKPAAKSESKSAAPAAQQDSGE